MYIIIIISYQFNLPIQMLTRNHKSGTYLNSMHILVVFLYYISHLCPQPYAAGLGPTVLILGIRGLCWIID